MASSKATASAGQETAILTDIDVEEVSLVTHPAIRRKFFLTKEDKMKIEDLVKDLQEAAVPAALVETIKALDPKAQTAVETAVKALEAVADMLPTGIVENLKALLEDNAPAEPVAAEEPAEKEAEPMSKEMQDIAKELEGAKAMIAKMAADRKHEVALAKADKYVVPNVSKEEVAELLENDIDGKFENMLSKAAAAFQKSGLLDSIGKSTADDVDPLDAATKKIMKSETGLTYEQAYVKALDANPELYKEG